MLRTIATLALLAWLMPVPAHAQTAAVLVGVVEDAQGGALPGAAVTVRNLETGVTRALVADGEGRFAASGLPVGEYEVRAALSQFRPLVRTGIRLTVGENAV
ncbi:MAG TPA: carboxypeptidase-like regulatory domain-containing protein, partial [Vicinamibacterales bacterium]|nr:carboxypeptidase-like regulatory domain-containing protein [Vicinamibacterales bacterium]